jgi:hypothetical protein
VAQAALLEGATYGTQLDYSQTGAIKHHHHNHHHRFNNNNSAYLFNGTNSITIPHNSAFNSYPLTISTWIKTDASFTTGGGDIISKYISSSWNGWELNLEIINSGSARVIPSYLRSANPCNGIIEGYAICNNPTGMNYVGNLNNGNWQHLVFKVDSNGGVLYVNGQQVSQQAWIGPAGSCTNATQVTIGGSFKGKIDDLGVWNRALTQPEIQQLYTLSSTSYLWSTGATTATINVTPTQTTEYWVDVTTNGVTCRKYITITVGSATPAPIGANNQTVTQGSTLVNLIVTGQNILWYSTPFGGTPLPENTPLVNGVTYYASQTINGCESEFRLPVIVQITLSNDDFNSTSIVYSPNPVTDILSVRASIELKTAKICNMLGQTVMQQNFDSNEIQLDMSNLPTGSYLVIVESDNRKETFKIIKR